jgi:hypothetical protein
MLTADNLAFLNTDRLADYLADCCRPITMVGTFYSACRLIAVRRWGLSGEAADRFAIRADGDLLSRTYKQIIF